MPDPLAFKSSWAPGVAPMISVSTTASVVPAAGCPVEDSNVVASLMHVVAGAAIGGVTVTVTSIDFGCSLALILRLKLE